MYVNKHKKAIKAVPGSWWKEKLKKNIDRVNDVHGSQKSSSLRMSVTALVFSFPSFRAMSGMVRAPIHLSSKGTSSAIAARDTKPENIKIVVKNLNPANARSRVWT